MKTLLISLLYLYVALGVYFSFDNSFYIPDTNLLAAAFIVGLILDVLIIDTICAMVTSLFAKKDVGQVVGNTSPH